MTSSRLKEVVSKTTASAAGLRGEISRSESWRSRLAMAPLCDQLPSCPSERPACAPALLERRIGKP